MSDIINVLWVEDKIDLHQVYKEEACDFGLNLTPFSCWEKAKSNLDLHYDDYSAIILDAKCKLREGDADDAMDFLPAVIKELSILAVERNRTIPWFVLSAGGGEVGRLDWVKKHRLEWDDWEKDFYSKTIDRVALFTRIPEIAVHSNATQIKTILYKDVFDSLNAFKGIDVSSAKNILVKILIALHFDSKNFDPILHYNQLRQLVEHLFRACNKVGLVPDQCVPKGVVNLSDSLNYLGGKKAGKAGVRFGQENDRIVTPLVEKEIRSVLGLGNTNSHTVELDAADQKLIEELFRTANSKYVIFSLALQMCDVIVWLKHYISLHDNKDLNLGKCVVLPEENIVDKSEITLKEAKSKYEGKEFLPIKEQDGVWHCGDCLVRLASTHSGAIMIEEVTPNTDKHTKSKYKWYAKYRII